MVDVVLAAGANINARTRWWAGGFGVLDGADPALASYLIQRGAIVDAHAAARLGMLEELKRLVSNEPRLVHARGGDGQTPLHCASSVTIAEYLIDRGADLDARDVDHESTPAQYMISDRQEVARYLITRGCRTDILMAAALVIWSWSPSTSTRIGLRPDAGVRRAFPSRTRAALGRSTSGRSAGTRVRMLSPGREVITDLSIADGAEPSEPAACDRVRARRRAPRQEAMAAHPNLPATLSADDVSRLAAAAHDNNTGLSA
jgi:hypothetical protein